MTHINQEIPREQWADYLARISKQEHDEWVRVESISPEMGDQPLSERLPLVDIMLETKGSEAGAVQIIVGRENESITHRILEPERLVAELNGNGGVLECLEICERGNGKTLIFFERTSVFDDMAAPI
ncbi:hypothetical protein D187_005974 [Cystobacter fuscus DSM 2262]|uniref:Uncharacterized protein n=1 Tax=Cystobacter fuscus (strain ATCC 25194 / DSM 2262 / NBRC 100088 / M29) TaxID=1242864 RepID=S9PM86_CYSF2|nr:DUF5335 family protein [Cystobacter fuscus]EPX63567.1 hypothetical protein D187_005974 [Cystobacter fuscus DSM 2262]